MWFYGTISGFNLIAVARVLFTFSQNRLQVFCSDSTTHPSHPRASDSSMASSWALPVTSPDRLPALPTLPTVARQLWPGLIYPGDRDRFTHIPAFLAVILQGHCVPSKGHSSRLFLLAPSLQSQSLSLPLDHSLALTLTVLIFPVSKGSLSEPSPEDLVYTWLLVRP